ncbi:MAG: Triacylglycerol lipase [Halomonadaceae bacterium]|nr:MAG: Triacylglycerol lipase [Halomonadaceae bacterium]
MKHTLTMKPLLLGIAAAIALPLASAPVMGAPSVGPNDMSFYVAPSIFGTAKGDLIRYRETTVDLGPEAPAAKAWTVLYRSTDALGAENMVTGTVLVPQAAWQGSGQRPVLGYAVGTHGLKQSCAPSLQMAQGTDYENANIAASLNAGYAVLVSDNPGYTTGDSPTYLAGKSQGQAVLDMFTAASQLPGGNISANAPAAIWGYSQGGQTASWAGEIQQSYAPNLNLVGLAAGGTPADFPTTGRFLDGSSGSAFLLAAVIGLEEQYPDNIPLMDLISPQGEAAIATGKSQCVFEALFTFMNDSISDYTKNGETLDDVLSIPSVNEAVSGQNLGNGMPSAPMYHYHGQADEFIPLEQAYNLKQQYCAMNADVFFDLYPSEHIATQFQAAPNVLAYLGDRFAGRSAPNNCGLNSSAPVSTHNPGGGNFVVTLDEWELDAHVDLKTLNQRVVMPKDSSFSADADMTAQSLDGDLDIPKFRAPLNILLNLDVDLVITPEGPTTGSIALSNEGRLSINGDAQTRIKVASAGFGWFQIPFGCETEAPVNFPLGFEGPVSAMGAGGLRFTGTTNFPSMTGCGLFNGMFSALMSGDGQQYSFTVKPPAPVQW